MCIHRSLLVLPILFFFGCATAPPPAPKAPVFYPPLPNPPRIQHLTSFSGAGDFRSESSTLVNFIFGKESADDQVVVKPYGIGISKGRIYAIDTRGPGYVIFDLQRKSISPVRRTGAGSMQKPINLAIDDTENKYVTDTGRDQIIVFDKDENYVRAYGALGKMKPSDVLVLDDKLYVADVSNHRVTVLDKQTGAELFSFGGAGSDEGELFFPTNLALTPDGYLLVSDTGNYRIQKYTADGEFVRSFGAVGTGMGEFSRPKGTAVDRSGRFYVVDSGFENVQLFSPEGKLLLFFGGSGNNSEHLNLPADVEIDYDNVHLFQEYAEPGFGLEYIILVTSQFGLNKIDVFGFGKMEDMIYGDE